jgi:hypothetical protein
LPFGCPVKVLAALVLLPVSFAKVVEGCGAFAAKPATAANRNRSPVKKRVPRAFAEPPENLFLISEIVNVVNVARPLRGEFWGTKVKVPPPVFVTPGRVNLGGKHAGNY